MNKIFNEQEWNEIDKLFEYCRVRTTDLGVTVERELNEGTFMIGKTENGKYFYQEPFLEKEIYETFEALIDMLEANYCD